jgi:predicted Zn-dependent protease
MARKKKRRPEPPAKRAPLSPKLARQLDEAEALARRGKWDEADRQLRELSRAHPRQPDIPACWAKLANRVKDLRSYLEACERLVALRPGDPDLRLALAAAYLRNSWPALGLRTFRDFLARWPDHPEAGRTRDALARLEPGYRERLADLGLSGPDEDQLAAWHEEVQIHLERGEHAAVRRLAENILQARPRFAPVLNNLGESYWREGDLAQATACARRVLAFDPANVHALANLTRYLTLAGQPKEAQEAAARLRATEPANPDAWAKVAEARSCLGDDTGVLEAVEAARRCAPPPEGQTGAYLEHLGGVAAYRQGRAEEARERWQEALRLMPGFPTARENLDELRKPPEERHAAWPFPLPYWIPEPLMRGLMARVEGAAKRKRQESAQRPIRDFLQQHPELAALVPILLDRGDPDGRFLALHICLAAETPPLQEALRDFALSQRGPDNQRLEAAYAALKAGLIKPGPVRFWTGGDWTEVVLVAYELYSTPEHKHSEEVAELASTAHEALRQFDGHRAEQILNEALAKEPGAPDLLNNLAAAYSLQGRSKEARDLILQVHAEHPDYWFGRTGAARFAIEDGRLDEAEATLRPMIQQRRMHVSEYAALAGAEIDLELARGHIRGAQSWLSTWARLLPDHPHLALMARKIRAASGKGRAGELGLFS